MTSDELIAQCTYVLESDNSVAESNICSQRYQYSDIIPLDFYFFGANNS